MPEWGKNIHAIKAVNLPAALGDSGAWTKKEICHTPPYDAMSSEGWEIKRAFTHTSGHSHNLRNEMWPNTLSVPLSSSYFWDYRFVCHLKLGKGRWGPTATDIFLSYLCWPALFFLTRNSRPTLNWGGRLFLSNTEECASKVPTALHTQVRLLLLLHRNNWEDITTKKD